MSTVFFTGSGSKREIIFFAGIASLVVLFFFVRLLPYMSKPTGGFMSYYTSGKLLSKQYDMNILYDQQQFHDLIPVVTDSNVEEVYGPNPPTISILFLPFASLSSANAKLVWEIFSLICVVYSLLLLRRQLKLNAAESLLMLALAFGFTPLYINFVYGQFYALLLLLHILLLILWEKKNIFTASIALSSMLILKGYGIIFLILALMLKEWRLIGYTIINFGLMLCATFFWIRPEIWGRYVESLTTLSSAAPYAGTFQQNIQSLIAHTFSTDKWNASPLINSPEIVQPLIWISAALAIVLLLLFVRNLQQKTITFSFCGALIIGVLFSPRLADYHYILLLIPIVVMFKEFASISTAFQRIMFGIMLFLLSVKIPYHYSVFQNTWLGIFGFPRICGAVILLWITFRLISDRKTKEIQQTNPVTV